MEKKTLDGCWIHKNHVERKKALVWNIFFIAWIIGPVTLQRVTPVPVRVWWCGARVCALKFDDLEIVDVEFNYC